MKYNARQYMFKHKVQVILIEIYGGGDDYRVVLPLDLFFLGLKEFDLRNRLVSLIQYWMDNLPEECQWRDPFKDTFLYDRKFKLCWAINCPKVDDIYEYQCTVTEDNDIYEVFDDGVCAFAMSSLKPLFAEHGITINSPRGDINYGASAFKEISNEELERIARSRGMRLVKI